ncbi:prolyl aminopeptidase (EC:3.4.11.5), Serine peptidase, MEROPS family S33 [Actinokineospora globicatena]|nr:prolyl aminopeptidase (EC:3.4.11.5), Serine peptidase, MEROPS family S33 [Actinokineospora globicatena]GLW80870.1 proline iminopeptidase [Actinokineospora globicatena]GLW88063.1 proline iminopeptidase [Actinokineospora globicatena]
MEAMLSLYPPVEPHDRGMLDVGDGQRVYWEVSGNPRGKPVVVLHGGPGAGTHPVQRRHFDPTAYRVVLVDQRGAGRSWPHVGSAGADLTANTTWHLVADLERLREHLRIDRWQVFGGSWGATLALAYSQRHPDRVTEIILRGVFLLRRAELDWLYRGGAGAIFPEAWADFLRLVPEGHDPLAVYQALVTSPDPAVQAEAATAWSNWEGATVSLVPNPALVAQYADPSFAVPFARVALHYFANGGWLTEDQLLLNAHLLAGIPGRIIQGRYDAVCPPASAWLLARAWSTARLTILPQAGHSTADPGVLDALRAATDEFR